MKQVDFKRPNYISFIESVPDAYIMAFKIYLSGDAVYFISRKFPESIISIDLSDISSVIINDESFVILTRFGKLLLLPGGNTIVQLYSKSYDYAD